MTKSGVVAEKLADEPSDAFQEIFEDHVDVVDCTYDEQSAAIEEETGNADEEIPKVKKSPW